MVVCGTAQPRDRRPAPSPNQFEVGRHTFFDFGPPNDYYELLLIRPAPGGTSIQRITLTPKAGCTQPAKVETASAVIRDTVASLLGPANPCVIPEKELRRERKRCKKCVVFSGVNVALQVQCGSQTRVIRSDILDRDMFDPAAKTPEHASWTMQLLDHLDQAVGQGVMEKPIFPLPTKDEPTPSVLNAEISQELRSGRYEVLFQGAPDKLSDLYLAAQSRPPSPSIQLLSSLPFQPQVLVLPEYPPLARLANIEGSVAFKTEIGSDGSTTNLFFESGHPMLRPTVEKAVSAWKFSNEAVHQQIRATIEFKTNCPVK
jgi:TonB family protein